MDASNYLRIVRAQWKTLVAVILVGGIAALLVSLLSAKSYTATAILYVSAEAGDTPNAAYQGSLLSEQRVKSYTELATSDRVLSNAAERLPGATVQDLRSKVNASTTTDSVLITIDTTDQDPVAASAIANSVGESVIAMVNDIERPSDPRRLQPVEVRAVQPALPPVSPSSWGIGLTTLVGLFVGFAVGLIFLFARELLATGVRSPEALESATGAPTLGVVPSTNQSRDGVDVLSTSPEVAEAYRKVRTGLEYVNIDEPSKLIAVTSSLPGEGKTTTSVNVASLLALSGYRVLLIDGDLRKPRIAEALTLEQNVGLSTVLLGRLNLQSAIQPYRAGRFDVLASGVLPPNPSELLASNQLVKLLSEASNSYDKIVIDTAPVLPVTDTVALAPHVDGVLVVCKFNDTKEGDLVRAVQGLRSVQARILGTVLNMAPRSNRGQYGTYDPYYGSSKNEVPELANDRTETMNSHGLEKPTPFRRASG